MHSSLDTSHTYQAFVEMALQGSLGKGGVVGDAGRDGFPQAELWVVTQFVVLFVRLLSQLIRQSSLRFHAFL